MRLLRRKKFIIPAIAGIVALIGAGVAYGFYTSSGSGTGSAKVGTGSTVDVTQLALDSATLYDSVISPLPGNLPSEGFESDSVTELGNEIDLASAGQELSSVVVTMSSWACGNWAAVGSPPCTTTPGSTYPVPITLYIYNVGAGNTLGSSIADDTQTFNIPFRPSADPSACPSETTAWYDAAAGKCYNGLDTNITFNGSLFSTPNITLPGSIIYGSRSTRRTMDSRPQTYPAPTTH